MILRIAVATTCATRNGFYRDDMAFFIISGANFPTKGCWEIMGAQQNGAELRGFAGVKATPVKVGPAPVSDNPRSLGHFQ
jgi:hypothetical protein